MDYKNLSSLSSQADGEDVPSKTHGRRTLRAWIFLLSKLSGAAVLLFFLGSIFLTLVFGWLPVPATPLVVIRAVDSVFEGRLPRVKKDWVQFEKISPHLMNAAIAGEDMRFFEHAGFDWEAIAKARAYNARGTGKTRGASTISQQTAKNLFLWPARSWIRKGLEVYFTSLIELFWSKQRIMEVYLNIIEFGDGIYGAEAASQFYFKKSAVKLNRSEAALMLAVLPNPRRFLISRPSPYVRFRQTMIQRRMSAAAKSIP